jgi:hypothetical protein
MKTLLLLLLFPLACFAQQTTYTYTGAKMAGSMSGNTGVANYIEIQGSIVLAAPLAPNQANQTPVLVSYAFNNDPILTGGPAPGYVSFTASTVKGMVTAWNFKLTWNSGNSQIVMSLSNSGDSLNSSTIKGDCGAQGDPDLCSNWQVSNATAGVLIDAPPVPTQAQLQTLQAQVQSLQSRVSTLTTDYNAYLHGYIAEIAVINELNAALVTEKQLVLTCQKKGGGGGY